MSAIFISHSSKDNEAASELRALLGDQGYHSIFLDFDPQDGIPAGREWEQELYGQLRSCQAVIVLCSAASMSSSWCFAEITHARALGKNVFPVKVGDCVVNTILTARQVLDLTAGKQEGYARLWRGLKVLGMDARDAFDWNPRRSPYPGLLAFQEEDAAVFFGREPEIQEGLETLNRLRQFGGTRLLMVLGASGSGKSSLVRAGMIPRLRRDPERWLILNPMRPGKDPIKELAFALAGTFESLKVARPWQGMVRDLTMPGADAAARGGALIAQIEDLRVAARQREATVLLLIDQLEELFTYAQGAGAEQLLPLLKAALEAPASPLMAIGTLRSDFLGHIQVHPAARDLVFADLRVGSLPTERLARVIEAPAEMGGLRLEDGLTEALIQDTGPDALPLLAFALRELAECHGGDRLLTVNEYRKELGGLAGSVARSAEAVYRAKDLTAAEEGDLRQAFRAMVRVDDRGAYVRQPASRQSLPPGVAEILERFVQARLLVAGGEAEAGSLEVAHEVLFRSWERLRQWLDEDREFLLWQKRLRDAVAGWEKSSGDTGALLRGALLVEAERHFHNHPEAMNAVERSFFEQSLAQRQQEELDREQSRREREEIQRRSNRRLRIFLAAVLALLLVAIGSGLAAYRNGKAAEESAARAVLAKQQTVSQLIEASWRAGLNLETENLNPSTPPTAEQLWLRLEKRQASTGSWIPGTRWLYGYLRSLMDLEKVQSLAEMPVFVSGPHAGGFNFQSYDFGHYNPAFVRWAGDHLLPAAADPAFRQATASVYQKHVKDVARVYYLAHLYLAEQAAEAAVIREKYLESVRAFQGRTYDRNEAFNYGPGRVLITFADRFATEFTRDKNVSFGSDDAGPPVVRRSYPWLTDQSGYYAHTASGFWIRRQIDGTAPDFFAGLKKLLVTYDPEFLRDPSAP